MGKILFYIVIACIIGLWSCTSVRTNTYPPLPKKAVATNTPKTEAETKPPKPATGTRKTETKTQKPASQPTIPIQPEKQKPRFSDTTKVVVSSEAKTIHYGLSRQFDSTVTDFEKAQTENDKKKTDSACLKIDSFSETLAAGDSLKYEALFMRSECLIAKDEISEAQKVLTSLMNDKNLPFPILEKVLVRLGQVYCVMNRKNDAEAMFSRLKKQFPGSIYEALANCESVAPR
jgi:hypothetical protein